MMHIPAGSHEVVLKYRGTVAQRAGILLSASVALVVTFITLVSRARVRVPPRVVISSWSSPWTAPALIVILVAKVAWMDDAGFLLHSSTCENPYGAQAQTDYVFGVPGETSIRLCGWSVRRAAVRPGEVLRVTLYWQTDEEISRPLASFVHLVGSQYNPATSGPVWGQEDKQIPADHPVAHWVPGKLYRDSYAFDVSGAAPYGDYALEVGWWDTGSGVRLEPTASGGPAEGVWTASPWQSILWPGVRVVSPPQMALGWN
jgi:hypothetical protein